MDRTIILILRSHHFIHLEKLVLGYILSSILDPGLTLSSPSIFVRLRVDFLFLNNLNSASLLTLKLTNYLKFLFFLALHFVSELLL